MWDNKIAGVNVIDLLIRVQSDLEILDINDILKLKHCL